MSNKLINKIITIFFAIVFIVLSISFGVKSISTYKAISSLDELKKPTSESNNNNNNDISKEDLNEPIIDSSDNTDSSDTSISDKESLEFSESNNVGTRYDEDKPYYNLEILNLEVLSKYIPTKGNELLEVYTIASSEVQKIINKDTYCYIDESSIEFKNSQVSFTLINYSGDNKLTDITATLYEVEESDNSVITEFKIENIDVLKDYLRQNRDFLLYVYDTISNEVKSANKNVSSCYIDKSSIVKKDNKLSFDVLNSKNNDKIKNVTIQL